MGEGRGRAEEDSCDYDEEKLSHQLQTLCSGFRRYLRLSGTTTMHQKLNRTPPSSQRRAFWKPFGLLYCAPLKIGVGARGGAQVRSPRFIAESLRPTSGNGQGYQQPDHAQGRSAKTPIPKITSSGKPKRITHLRYGTGTQAAADSQSSWRYTTPAMPWLTAPLRASGHPQAGPTNTKGLSNFIWTCLLPRPGWRPPAPPHLSSFSDWAFSPFHPFGDGAAAIAPPRHASRWAHLVGAACVHPRERWSDHHARKSGRRPDGNSAISAICWRVLCRSSMWHSVGPSPDVAGMLRKPHRVPRVVGAVVGAPVDGTALRLAAGKSPADGPRFADPEDWPDS